jgi:heat shock protein HtpX
MERVNVYDQVTANKRSSYMLFIVFFVIAFILSFLISAYFGGGYAGTAAMMVLAILWSLFSYYLGDRAILALNGARAATKQEYPYLYNTVEGLSIAAGVPMPSIYVINDRSPNAFATGRDPKHSSVAVTTGLLETMNRMELEGVIAHELSHVKNYDIRYMTLVMVMIGLIGILSSMLVRMFWYGGRDRENRRGGGAILIIGIIFAILAPIIAQLVSLAISRKREYMADASGALLTRYPQGLADALKKISASHVPMTAANPDSAPLYIANPFRQKGFFDNLFSTHPPIEDRIKKLESM